MTTDKQPITLEDFWTLRTVSDVQLSPDGTTVAYVVGRYDEAHNSQHTAIWVAGVAGGQPRQLTSGEALDSSPRWAPDGSRLAFVSTRHESKPQIYVLPLAGGEARRVTSVADGATSPVWAPDGTRLCYASTPETDRQKVKQEEAWFAAHPEADAAKTTPRLRLQTSLMARFDGRGYVDRRVQLYVIAVDEPAAEPRQLTSGDYDHLDAIWSPDGATIAFVTNRTPDAEHNLVGDIWTVAVEGGEPTCLTRSDLSALGASPVWSPDGETIAFYAQPEWVKNGVKATHVWTVSRTGGDQRDLSAGFDQSCGGGIQPDYTWPAAQSLVWSPDGTTVYALAVEHGDSAVFAFDAATGSARRVSSPGACVTGVQCCADGKTLVVLASTPSAPFDVFTLPATGGEVQPLAQTNQDWLANHTIAPTERLSFTGPDDWTIEGWLIRPLAADSIKPYPLILHVHGGPFGAWGNAFYFQAQALAAAGYASLYINPRGSFGQGWAFTRAADWGEKDFADLLAGVEAVLSRGEIDPRQVGITGISYGGFMTNWALGHSDRFAAGVSVNGVSNFFSMYGVSDITPLWFETEFDGPYWTSEEHWQRYRHHSPITYVDRITAPLLLLQSENDYRCPIDQGEQMLTALRMRRQTVELIRFPGASHVIVVSGTPHQRFLQWSLAKDWFDTYLKGIGEPALDEAQVEEEAGVVAAAPSIGAPAAP